MSVITENTTNNLLHLDAIFKFATLGILITDKTGYIIAINPHALKEFGYTESELTGEKIELLIPEKFREAHIEHHLNYINKRDSNFMGPGKCLYALRKDGTEFPVEISLSNYLYNDHKYVIAYITNISDQKNAEERILKLNKELELKVGESTNDLKDTLHQLELSNELLDSTIAYQQAILNNAGAIIIATDIKGMIKLFNPEAAARLGYTESEIINRKKPLLFHDADEIELKRKDLFNEFGIVELNDFDVLVEKAKRNIHDEQQCTFITKDGSSFPVSLTITSIKDSNGIIIGFMGIAIDISSRKKIERELIQSLEKEKELGELKSRFVSMASHEFRTPLSTVLSSAYLIEKYNDTADQPKREKHLQRIISSVEMLTGILNDFLNLGKIEEGKIQVKFSQFNFPELIRGIINEMKSGLKKDQKIFFQHNGKTDINLDASLLKHITMNLISNASKFSNEGSSIEVNTFFLDQQAILSVKDNGIGISIDDQKHLMERFFRGANAGNIQGTGLGLHIVSRYAEMMNGTMECKSELEKGTEYFITFNIKND